MLPLGRGEVRVILLAPEYADLARDVLPGPPPLPSWAELPPPPFLDGDTPPVLAELFRLDPLLAGKIDAHSEAGCWYWTGATVRAGQRRGVRYGKLCRRRHGGMWLVHRWVHTIATGPIPDGYEVHHTCPVRRRRTLCCNPRHLWALHPDDHERIQREEEGYATAA